LLLRIDSGRGRDVNHADARHYARPTSPRRDRDRLGRGDGALGGLGSNRFAVALDDPHGAVVVDQLDALAPAVRRLLSDSARWEELSRRGRATAPAEVDWDAYVERVAAFLREAVQ
jgi:hypothetical protein